MSDDLDLLRTKVLLIGYTVVRGENLTGHLFYPYKDGELVECIYTQPDYGLYGKRSEAMVLEAILKHEGLL